MADNTGFLQFQNVEEYTRKKIAEVDPNIDTRPNSGVGDILIKALNAILDPIVTEALRVQDNQSLDNAANMTEPELDAIVANIFVTRRTGAPARGSVRIFFSEPTAVTIAEASEFVTDTGIRFFSLIEVTITANQMSINKDGDFFFVDVTVEAETAGTEGNVAAGAIVEFVGGPTNLVNVDNPEAFTGGVQAEGNTELVDRAKIAITVRDLVSKPAIKTVLLEQFVFLRDVEVIGFGDPDMERDFLIGTDMTLGLFPPVDELGSTLGIHIGGKVDIYIRVISLSTETVRIDNLKQFVFLRPKDEFDPVVDPVNVQFVDLVKRPIIEVETIQPIDPITGDPIGSPLIKDNDFKFIVDNQTLRFSTRDRTKLEILNGLLLNGSYLLTTSHSPDVVTVQDFVENDDNRVVTADLLVKFTNPAFVDFTAVVKIDPTSGNTVADLEAKSIEFVNNLGVGERLEVSDLVNLFYENGATFVQLPFTVTVTLLNSDGTETVTASDNFVDIPATAAVLARNIVITEA